MSAKKEWQAFRVIGQPSKSKFINFDCQPLRKIAHVAHVPIALRIVEDARLRADLIFDESKLKAQRIRVVWLSPNDWSNGFRYGNIRFSLDWLKLIEGKRYYWVEGMSYHNPAARILVTDQDWSKLLEEYDPAEGDGPWWHAPDGIHYWNGNKTLEIMFEGDIPLPSVTKVDFVKHHPKQCSDDWTTCRYCGVERSDGGAEFLAALAHRQSTYDIPGLVAEDPLTGTSEASFDLDTAVSYLASRVEEEKVTTWGAVCRTDAAAQPLARAVLGAMGRRRASGDLPQLMALFKSATDLRFSIGDAIASAAGLPSAEALGRKFRPQPSDEPF